MNPDVLDALVGEIAALRRDLDIHLRAHARHAGPYANPADREAARAAADRFIAEVRRHLEALQAEEPET